jgi:hypothetical protein
MPRIAIQLQDYQQAEELEDLEEWEEWIGLRDGDERLRAQLGSSEMQDRRRNARGSYDSLQARRSERRKSIRRGGKRI